MLVPKTDGEKTKGIPVDQLKVIKSHFDKVSTLRLLDTNEKSLLNVIEQRISGKYEDPGTPTPQQVKISEAELREAFGGIDGVATQALADK